MSSFYRVIVFVFVAFASISSSTAQVSPTLDIDAVSGHWIQAYSSQFLNTTIEREGSCVQALIQKKGPTLVAAAAFNLFTPSGPLVIGISELVQGLDTFSFSFFGFPRFQYTIVAVSPVDPDSHKYTWASKFPLHL
jgi:hypothetical protein